MTNEEFALERFRRGEAPSYSTGICGSTTCGYGKLDQNGYWEFPLYLEEEDKFSIPRHQFDTIMLRAQVELIQKVDRLIKLLEKEHGQQEEGKSDEGSSVVETPT